MSNETMTDARNKAWGEWVHSEYASQSEAAGLTYHRACFDAGWESARLRGEAAPEGQAVALRTDYVLEFITETPEDVTHKKLIELGWTPPAAPAPTLREGDARKIDGRWMVCTDPEMERFVSFDGQDTPAPVAGEAVGALLEAAKRVASHAPRKSRQIDADWDNLREVIRETDTALAQDRAAQADVIEADCTGCGAKVFAWPQHRDSSTCLDCVADRASQAGAAVPSFSVIASVCNALTRLGVAVPESKEEQAARADDLIEDLCRTATQPPAVGVDVSEEMVSAGTVLSNIVYNLAQDDRLPEALCTSLDAARKRWDAALRTGGAGS